MTKEEAKKAYLKGYEAGLKDAWGDISRLTTRGYSATELNIMAKSKIAVISRAVEEKARGIDASEVTIEAVKDSEAAGKLPARRGSYAIKEEKAEQILDYFVTLVQAGHRGLCISRMHPRDLSARLDSRAVKYLWLSKSEGEAKGDLKSVSPTELSSIAAQAVGFMEKNEKSTILLEGVEYLVSQNGFQPVLKFVQMLSERTVLFDTYLLLSINPQAMSEREYRQIAKEMTGEL